VLDLGLGGRVSAVDDRDLVGVNREALAEQLIQAGRRSSNPAVPPERNPARFDDTIL